DLLLETLLQGAPRGVKLVVAGPDECGLWPGLAGCWLRPTGAAARVVRLDAVSGKDKTALLAAASLFALPSEHENFGNAALEALATGTPVLLSPHVDLTGSAGPELPVHRVPLDAPVWAERLATLLAHPDRLTEAADATRRAVWGRYAWRTLAAE